MREQLNTLKEQKMSVNMVSIIDKFFSIKYTKKYWVRRNVRHGLSASAKHWSSAPAQWEEIYRRYLPP